MAYLRTRSGEWAEELAKKGATEIQVSVIANETELLLIPKGVPSVEYEPVRLHLQTDATARQAVQSIQSSKDMSIPLAYFEAY